MLVGHKLLRLNCERCSTPRPRPLPSDNTNAPPSGHSADSQPQSIVSTPSNDYVTVAEIKSHASKMKCLSLISAHTKGWYYLDRCRGGLRTPVIRRPPEGVIARSGLIIPRSQWLAAPSHMALWVDQVSGDPAPAALPPHESRAHVPTKLAGNMAAA